MQSTAMNTQSQQPPKKLPPLTRSMVTDSPIKNYLEFSPIDERLSALGPFKKKSSNPRLKLSLTALLPCYLRLSAHVEGE